MHGRQHEAARILVAMAIRDRTSDDSRTQVLGILGTFGAMLRQQPQVSAFIPVLSSQAETVRGSPYRPRPSSA
jgi:hypothetical protein